MGDPPERTSVLAGQLGNRSTRRAALTQFSVDLEDVQAFGVMHRYLLDRANGSTCSKLDGSHRHPELFSRLLRRRRGELRRTRWARRS